MTKLFLFSFLHLSKLLMRLCFYFYFNNKQYRRSYNKEKLNLATTTKKTSVQGTWLLKSQEFQMFYTYVSPHVSRSNVSKLLRVPTVDICSFLMSIFGLKLVSIHQSAREREREKQSDRSRRLVSFSFLSWHYLFSSKQSFFKDIFNQRSALSLSSIVVSL